MAASLLASGKLEEVPHAELHAVVVLLLAELGVLAARKAGRPKIQPRTPARTVDDPGDQGKVRHALFPSGQANGQHGTQVPAKIEELLGEGAGRTRMEGVPGIDTLHPGGGFLQIPEGAMIGIAGLNSAGEATYTGPCPPSEFKPSEHRYFFKLYALSGTVNFVTAPTKQELLDAIEGQVIENVALMGRYKRNAKSI